MESLLILKSSSQNALRVYGFYGHLLTVEQKVVDIHIQLYLTMLHMKNQKLNDNNSTIRNLSKCKKITNVNLNYYLPVQQKSIINVICLSFSRIGILRISFHI